MRRINLRKNSMMAAAVSAGIGLIGLATPVHATVYTWTGQALTGLWNQNSFNVTNWSGNVIPASSTSTQLVFSSFTNQGNPNQNIGSPFDLNRLTFGGTGFILDGQPLRFMANGATLPQIVHNANSSEIVRQDIRLGADLTFGGTSTGPLTLTGIISDGGGGFALNKTSPGLLVLHGIGGYKGLSVNAGSVILDGDATTALSASLFESAMNVTGGATVSIENGSVVTSIANNGSSYINGTAGTAVTVDGADTQWRSGFQTLIGTSGVGSITLQNGGALTCNNYLIAGAAAGGSGTLLVQSGGSVSSNDSALGLVGGARGTATVTGAGSAWTMTNLGMGGLSANQGGGSGTLNVVNGGSVSVTGTTMFWAPDNILNIDAGSFTTGALNSANGVGGTIKVTDAIGEFALTVGTNNSSGRFAGQIVNGAGGSGSLMKVGSGTLTLGGGASDSAANSNSFIYVTDGALALDKAQNADAVGGTLWVSGGTVVLNRSEQIRDTSTVTIFNGTLDLNGFRETIRDLQGGPGTINLGAGALTVSPLLGSSFSGTINGPQGTLYKTGPNLMTLGGTGTLEFLNVSGGRLNISGGTYTVDSGLQGDPAVEVRGASLALSGGAKLTTLGLEPSASFTQNGVGTITGAGTQWHATSVAVGNNGTGALTIENQGSLQVDSVVVARGFASGTMLIQSGGSANSDNAILGSGTFSIGVATVTGTNSSWTSNQLNLGGRDATHTGGEGTLNVLNGGNVSIAGATRFWSAGQFVNIDRATLTTGSIDDATAVGSTIAISDPAGGVALTVGANDGGGSFNGKLKDSAGGAGSIRKIGGGTFTISGSNNSYSGATTIDAGALVVTQPRALGGGTVNINSALGVLKTGLGGAPRVAALNITGTGIADMTDNDLVIGNDTAKPQVESYVRSARNGGAWNGASGITSSSAKNHPTHSTTLGVLSGAEFTSVGGAGVFSGEPYSAADTLVKYTYYGDTDFSGLVNFDDYSRTDAGFNNGRSGWINGDFDYSGAVDFDDYSLIDLAFNTQSGTLRRAMSYLDGGDRSDNGMNVPSLRLIADHFQQFGNAYASSFVNAVPEPGSVALTSAVSILAFRRRRHQ